MLPEIKNRGAEDVCIVVCDGLKGLPELINTAWQLATVQTCTIQLIRNTFRFASRSLLGGDGQGSAPAYTALTRDELRTVGWRSWSRARVHTLRPAAVRVGLVPRRERKTRRLPDSADRTS
nr:transposase [Leifsonia sp. AG29]